MRVLLVNNRYREDGGAETVILETERLLRAAGHEAVPFAVRHPDDAPTPWSSFFAAPARGAMSGSAAPRPRIYSLSSRRAVRRLVRRVRPDVAHVHNAYEQLTLSVMDALRSEGVPIVVTLHDYRAVCPSGYLLAPDGPCVRCVERGSTLHAVAHRCVRGSVARSAVAAAECSLNRRRDRYGAASVVIAPSDFLGRVVCAGGLPGDRIRTVRNPVALGRPRNGIPSSPRFVYAGRMVLEKGLDVLLDASTLLADGARITLVGDGRDASHVRRRVASERLPVDLLGRIPRHAVAARLRDATAAVLPSLWFENCPMAILEAGAVAVPTVATGLGAIPELIADGVDGVLVERGDARSLAAAMNRLVRSPGAAARLGRNARARVRRAHGPARYLSSLLEAYADAICG